MINYIILDQVDDDLTIEQKEILTYISTHEELPEIIKVKDQTITYSQTEHIDAHPHFRTIKHYDKEEKEQRSFRELAFTVPVNKVFYKVTVTKSLEEMGDLIHSILFISIATILGILITTLVINRLVLKKLWNPFYETLEQLRRFKISKKNTLHFYPTPIEEFSFMNEVLQNTTTKAQSDYFNLKEFTENASHELQTPLAIIRSKLDLLIQDEDLSKRQNKALEEAYKAVQKLSKLNHSLLLLAKIENDQFETITLVPLKEKMEQKLHAFEELVKAAGLTIHASLENATIKINPQLCDLLLNNLFSNAIKHNYEGGLIQTQLSQRRLSIANTGLMQGLDEELLFKRFSKLDKAAESNGLGLSIVKQICENTGAQIAYRFEDSLHYFIVTW